MKSNILTASGEKKWKRDEEKVYESKNKEKQKI